MAIQIVPQEGWGEKLGSDIGNNLSQGLQKLAQMKMQHVLQRHQQGQNKKGLKTLFPGMKDEELEGLSQMDPNLLQHLLSPRGLLRQKMANSVEKLTGVQQQVPQMQQQQQIDPISQLLQSLQQTPPAMFAANQLQIPQQQVPQQNIQRSRQIRKGTKKLTARHVDAFLRKAGNDPKKAKELAVLAGYEV